jgi:hypothetical protein
MFSWSLLIIFPMNLSLCSPVVRAPHITGKAVDPVKQWPGGSVLIPK